MAAERINYNQLACSLACIAQSQACLLDSLTKQHADRNGTVLLTRATMESFKRTLRKSALLTDRISVLLDEQVEIELKEIS